MESIPREVRTEPGRPSIRFDVGRFESVTDILFPTCLGRPMCDRARLDRDRSDSDVLVRPLPLNPDQEDPHPEDNHDRTLSLRRSLPRLPLPP